MIDSEELANDAMQDEMERISFKQGSANALGNDLSSDQRRLFSEKILRLCNRRISSTVIICYYIINKSQMEFFSTDLHFNLNYDF